MPRARPPWSPTVLALASILCGALYGRLTSVLPSPTTPGTFWLSNLATPWLVLPYAAGWLQDRKGRAAVVGALTDVSSTIGFYWHFLLLDHPRPGPRGAVPSLVGRIEGNAIPWLQFIAPWVAVSIVAGCVCGVLGSQRRERKAVLPCVAIGLAFIAEPFAWSALLGYTVPPAMWVGELAVGLAIITGVAPQALERMRG